MQEVCEWLCTVQHLGLSLACLVSGRVPGPAG